MNDVSEPVTLVGLLEQLVPPPEPSPVSMLPQTGGWIVVALLLVAGVLLLLWKRARRRRANAYRRAALAALEAAGDNPVTIAEILRRTALAAYPRRTVASLSGEKWLGFLDRTLGGDRFRNGPGRVLIEAPYRGHAAPSSKAARLARLWVRRHHREEAGA